MFVDSEGRAIWILEIGHNRESAQQEFLRRALYATKNDRSTIKSDKNIALEA
jgi:hypothetical protein